MLESAILFETNSQSNFDYIITVTASENTRMTRVLKRDNLSVTEVMAKMENQLPELEKIEKSDFIVINDGYDLIDSLWLLTKQVDTIKKAINHDLLVKAFEILNEISKANH
jgi:dephospho-CoA kinase